MLSELLQARARSGEQGDIVTALQPWMTFLREHANSSGSGELRLADYTVPENFIDCTPSNLLRDGNELVPIDLEWHSNNPVPLGWVVTRGVIWSLGRGVPRSSQPVAVSEIVVALCRAASLSVEEADIQRWIALEACFQTAVTGRQWQPEMLQHMASGVMSFTEEIARSGERIRQTQIDIDKLTAEAAANVAAVAAQQQQLRAQLAAEAARQSETRKQLESVLQSRSWKLTSILRWARRLV